MISVLVLVRVHSEGDMCGVLASQLMDTTPAWDWLVHVRSIGCKLMIKLIENYKAKYQWIQAH